MYGTEGSLKGWIEGSRWHHFDNSTVNPNEKPPAATRGGVTPPPPPGSMEGLWVNGEPRRLCTRPPPGVCRFESCSFHVCPENRHCLLRIWEAGRWWLACLNCPYRIEE